MGRYLNFLGLMFVLVLGQTPAALATDYEFTTIDFPGAPFSEALGISNVGEIVGALDPQVQSTAFYLRVARRATRAAVSPRRGIPERGRPRRIAG